jgi:medium-chain acyl-[acyl-carrier-protein] hydrolase
MTLPNNWVICQQRRNSAALRLFCFPYAGGGASAYRTWNKELTSDIEVCWIQWPGRENRIRERPFETIDELVPALVNGLSEWLVPPFAFYGHSLGAKIAFETTRHLRRTGKVQPSHLFVGASQAPQLPWPHPPLHVLREDEFIKEVQKRYGGVPREVLQDAELRALLIPTLRADVRLIETYRYDPEPPLNCAITVFGGSDDNTVDRIGLDAWRHQTSQAFRLLMVAGDHFFLHSARQQLLNAIGGSLN